MLNTDAAGSNSRSQAGTIRHLLRFEGAISIGHVATCCLFTPVFLVHACINAETYLYTFTFRVVNQH